MNGARLLQTEGADRDGKQTTSQVLVVIEGDSRINSGAGDSPASTN